MTTTTDFEPKIYVGTYAKYNNGSINGAWLTLTDYDDAEAFYEACSQLHKDEEDPEFMFQAYEGFPESYYSESGGITELYELIDFVNGSYYDFEVIEAALDLDIPLESIEEAYRGEYSSDEEFAEYLIEETGELNNIPDWVSCHINWSGVARDLMLDFNESNGHYFYDYY